MNDILKQRLVGALILVALGVVFWPIIFVEPGERFATEQSRMPPPPGIDLTPTEPPGQDGLRASPEWGADGEQGAEAPGLEEVADADDIRATPGVDLSPVDVSPVEESHTRVAAPEHSMLDSRGVPVAWILLVASVSSEVKADELRDQLLEMQEKAYVKKLERDNKDLYRVYVGPNFERAQLEKIQAGINFRFGVSSMIIRYTP